MEREILKKRIAQMDIDSVRSMRGSNLSRLTNGFEEPFVRLILSKATTINDQLELINYLERVHWIQHRTNSKSLDDLRFDIECGLLITENGSVLACPNETVEAQPLDNNEEVLALRKRVKDLVEENEKYKEENQQKEKERLDLQVEIDKLKELLEIEESVEDIAWHDKVRLDLLQIGRAHV